MLRTPFAKRLACACAAVVLIGCVTGASDDKAPAQSKTDAANTLVDQPQDRPGVPHGCTMVWSPTARDSVVNCPDIRPPSPR